MSTAEWLITVWFLTVLGVGVSLDVARGWPSLVSAEWNGWLKLWIPILLIGHSLLCLGILLALR